MRKTVCTLLLIIIFIEYSNLLRAQSDFEISVISKGVTRIKVADNLSFDIVGEYENGARPGWENISTGKYFFGNTTTIQPVVEGFNAGEPVKLNWTNTRCALGEKDHKAVLVLDKKIYADIDTKGEAVVLRSQPQSFQLINFRSQDRKGLVALEQSVDKSVAGGASGSITLSANDKGDIEVSFEVLCIKAATSNDPAVKSRRYTLRNAVFPNTNSIARATELKQQTEKAEAALKKAHAEQDRLTALKVKNSYTEIAKLQSTYPSNYSCIKPAPGKKEEEYTAYVEYEGVRLDYDPFDLSQSDNTKYKPVRKKRIVEYTGQKNNCNKPVIIKGIVKFQSIDGDFFFEDRSIKLKPGEMTINDIVIETNYDPETAQVGIRHYYINNLPVKNKNGKLLYQPSK